MPPQQLTRPAVPRQLLGLVELVEPHRRPQPRWPMRQVGSLGARAVAVRALAWAAAYVQEGLQLADGELRSALGEVLDGMSDRR